MKLTQFSLTIAAVFLTAQASAATPKLGVVYDAGGKFDKSFNQSAFEGASRFKKDTGISFIEVQASSDTQAEQVMRGLARKKLDMIAAIGFAQTQAVQKVAKEFPNVKFVLIDGQAAGSNVNSVVFKEEEGSYLVGVAAAMASKSKKVGLHRRHRYPADPQLRLRLRARRQGHQSESGNHAKHGRYHLRRLE